MGAVVLALVRRRRDPSVDLTADEVVSIRSRIAGYGGTTVPVTDDPVVDDTIPEAPVVEPTGITDDDPRADGSVKPIHEDISSE